MIIEVHSYRFKTERSITEALASKRTLTQSMWPFLPANIRALKRIPMIHLVTSNHQNQKTFTSLRRPKFPCKDVHNNDQL